MKKLMRDRYHKDSSFKMLQKNRCALNVKRKFRQMKRFPQRETESLEMRVAQTDTPENKLINEAISVFSLNMKAGPTYVCTVSQVLVSQPSRTL